MRAQRRAHSNLAAMQQRVALVTGGGGGIGRAIARELCRSGVFVYVAGRDRAKLDEARGELEGAGGGASALELDVTDPRSIRSGLATAIEQSGSVDWLVNNAGIARSAPLQRAADPDLYALHMSVNFDGARRVFEGLLPHMLAAGYGRVVQIGSSAALRGYGYVAAYVASKHALLGYTRSAALELKRKGIALNMICPHYVDSPMTDASARNIAEQTGRSEEEARATLAAANPGGKLVHPNEIAELARRLLASDTSGAVVELTGSEEREVESGWTLGKLEK